MSMIGKLPCTLRICEGPQYWNQYLCWQASSTVPYCTVHFGHVSTKKNREQGKREKEKEEERERDAGRGGSEALLPSTWANRRGPYFERDAERGGSKALLPSAWATGRGPYFVQGLGVKRERGREGEMPERAREGA